MAAPRKYPNELRQRAIKLVVDAVAENDESVSGACGRIGPQLGINADTLRGWMKQVQIDQGERPGLTTSERQRLQTLERGGQCSQSRCPLSPLPRGGRGGHQKQKHGELSRGLREPDGDLRRDGACSDEGSAKTCPPTQHQSDTEDDDGGDVNPRRPAASGRRKELYDPYRDESRDRGGLRSLGE